MEASWLVITFYRLDNRFWRAAAVSQLSAQYSNLVSPNPPAVPFTASLGLVEGIGSGFRAHLSHVSKKGWLLVLRPWGAFTPCFLLLFPRDSEGLGQAAVLNMAGVGASVFRGDLHHHPGLVRVTFTEIISPWLSLHHTAGPSPVQTDWWWVKVVGQALEGICKQLSIANIDYIIISERDCSQCFTCIISFYSDNCLKRHKLLHPQLHKRTLQ